MIFSHLKGMKNIIAKTKALRKNKYANYLGLIALTVAFFSAMLIFTLVSMMINFFALFDR